jgi:hypothetical protein
LSRSLASLWPGGSGSKVLSEPSESGAKGKAEISVLIVVESAGSWVRRLIQSKAQPE